MILGLSIVWIAIPENSFWYEADRKLDVLSICARMMSGPKLVGVVGKRSAWVSVSIGGI